MKRMNQRIQLIHQMYQVRIFQQETPVLYVLTISQILTSVHKKSLVKQKTIQLGIQMNLLKHKYLIYEEMVQVGPYMLAMIVKKQDFILKMVLR